ncbi:MAG: methylenetetrahydrofolate--tRNA-(uracil(54)-C(5))-methyltransferase (FADH(2)-oxidizing) TrmFO [Bdellovibrionota bacterium]
MNTTQNKVAIIGAGLAGCECAWILAEIYGMSVTLFEMKSISPTPAQVSPHLFSELVCSNSLKSKSRLNPAGILKQEIKKLGSLIIPAAIDTEVPAGETLAVDRENFSNLITQKLKTHKNVSVVECVVESVAQIFTHSNFDAVVIATGPLTGQALSEDLIKVTNSQDLYFYDAIAPIIDGESIDYSIAFKANRKTRTHAYEKANAVNVESVEETEGDYLNLPLNKDEYLEFVKKVVEGDKVPHHPFEEPRYFNGCQPIEVLAERGERTLSFGPMKARGLDDPRTGRWPYAVVQLRKENLGDTAWSMVGFQTRLTWTAQKQIFKTLPGLAQAEFFRMGSMHRNTYLVSPNILNTNFSFKADSRLYLAGQIMGVEGYLESAAMGVFIGHCIGNKLVHKKDLPLPPANTSLGALAHYCLFAEAKHFSPMNIHWGLFSDLTTEDIEKYSKNSHQLGNKKKLEKSVKRDFMASRAEFLFDGWLLDNIGQN